MKWSIGSNTVEQCQTKHREFNGIRGLQKSEYMKFSWDILLYGIIIFFVLFYYFYVIIYLLFIL